MNLPTLRVVWCTIAFVSTLDALESLNLVSLVASRFPDACSMLIGIRLGID